MESPEACASKAVKSSDFSTRFAEWIVSLISYDHLDVYRDLGRGLNGKNRIGMPKFLILRAGNGCLGGVRVVMVLLLTQFPSNEKTTFRI